MGSFSQSTFASPVEILPPPHQLSSPHYTMSTDPSTFQSTFSGFTSSQPATPLSAAGRKRSRDEAGDNLEEEYFPTFTEPIKEVEEDWEYGEGMVLIKPNGYIIDASSQTGTWAEERAISQQAQTPPAVTERPLMRSHKSQRLDTSMSTQPIVNEVGFGTTTHTLNGVSSASSPPKSGAAEPTVDDFTLHLGIGWSQISSDEHIQAAARGWAKYIENHYPVHDVQIRLQSKGLASYLVEAREGWFLFGEDLKEGRLVSQSLERTFVNLRSTPPVFDGAEILVAAVVETPKADVNEATMTSGLVMNGTVNRGDVSDVMLGDWQKPQSPGLVQEVEMDMS